MDLKQLHLNYHIGILRCLWTRDGQQIAVSRGLVNSDAVLISNFK